MILSQLTVNKFIEIMHLPEQILPTLMNELRYIVLRALHQRINISLFFFGITLIN